MRLCSGAFHSRPWFLAIALHGAPPGCWRKVLLDGDAYTIVAVLRRGFRYAGEPLAGTASEIDIWLPLENNPLMDGPRGPRFLKMSGRLAPQPERESERSPPGSRANIPISTADCAWTRFHLRPKSAGVSFQRCCCLMSAVALLALIASANVANVRWFGPFDGVGSWLP